MPCLEPDALISSNLLFIGDKPLSVYSFKINLLQKKALFHKTFFSLKRGSVMYKTIYVINIIIYMCSQHSSVL